MIWVVVLACIFLIPLITSDVYQGTFFALCCLLVIALFIHAILTGTYLKDRIVAFWLIAWLLTVFLTSLFCQYKHLAFNKAFYFFLYAAVFFMISGLGSEKRKQLLILIAFASAFISIRGILQHVYFFNMVMPYIETQKSLMPISEFLHIKDVIERGRVISSFVTPNLLASYLAMVNLVVLGLMATVKTKSEILGLGFLFLLNLACLLLTASIAGLGSLVLGIFLFAIGSFLILPQRKPIFKKKEIFLGAVMVILLISLFAKRFFQIGADSLLNSLQGRIQFWQTALYIIKTRPFSFSGLGSFGYMFGQFVVFSKLESSMAHNLFLQLWIETGIYGLIAFLAFLTAVGQRVKKRIILGDTQLNKKFQYIALLSAVFAFLINNMAGFSFFIPQVALIWWVLFSLLISNENST